MNEESIRGIIFAIPVLFIIFFIMAVSSSAKKIRTQDLREKVKSLPLSEEAINERLEVFDRICARVENDEVKMRLLEKLADGEPVPVTKETFKKEELEVVEQRKDDYLDDIVSGIIPSRACYRHRHRYDS